MGAATGQDSIYIKW